MFHFWPFWFFWPFHGSLLTLVLIIVLLVMVFRHRPAHYAYPDGTTPASGRSPTPGTPPVTPPSPTARSEALAIVEGRYARGEIQRDEYLQKRADLGG